jgi:hypothetical protein
VMRICWIPYQVRNDRTAVNCGIRKDTPHTSVGIKRGFRGRSYMPDRDLEINPPSADKAGFDLLSVCKDYFKAEP